MSVAHCKVAESMRQEAEHRKQKTEQLIQVGDVVRRRKHYMAMAKIDDNWTQEI